MGVDLNYLMQPRVAVQKHARFGFNQPVDFSFRERPLQIRQSGQVCTTSPIDPSLMIKIRRGDSMVFSGVA